jgi:hypothetical protein
VSGGVRVGPAVEHAELLTVGVIDREPIRDLAIRAPYFDTTRIQRPASRGGDAGQYGHCSDHPKEMIGTDAAPARRRQ